MTENGDAGAGGNARLAPAEGGDAVVFAFNPASIVISHMAPMQTSNGHGGHHHGGDDKPNVVVNSTPDEAPKANGTTSIVMRALTFTGQEVRATCDRLLGWTLFKEAAPSALKKQDLPELRFSWGSQIYLVNLNQVTINYTRFTRDGTPIRAVVDLTLHSVPKIPAATNPSSGGQSGRRTHLLTGAETLPELATRTYGRPEHWREIATANGIEDPLRVRPGARLYLPSMQEGGR